MTQLYPIPQNVLESLSASRLVATDAVSELTSVSNLASWIAGTANQITVTDDADGTITLSGPQDLHTGASPTFVGLNLTGATITTPLNNDITISTPTSEAIPAGNIIITGGSTPYIGGSIALTGGDLSNDSGTIAGNISIKAGNVTGGSSGTPTAGNITLTGGSYTVGLPGAGGDINLLSGQYGSINITASDSGGAEGSGDINLNITPGDSGPSGQIYCNGETRIQSLSGLLLGTSGVVSAITDNSANWNTAYGWGDHAGAYLPIGGGTLTGHLLFTDATYDIGATGATRPRDLFLSGAAVVGGKVTAGTSTTIGFQTAGYVSLGTGVGAVATPVNLNYSTSGSLITGINVNVVNTRTLAGLGNNIGLGFTASWIPTDDMTINRSGGAVYGLYGSSKIDSTNLTSGYNITIGSAHGGYFWVAATKGASHSGTVTITSGYGVRIADATITGATPTITTLYGLHIANQTKGATNYAIYSAGGQSYHAGNFGIGVIPTVALDVVGAIQTTTTIKAGTGFGCNGTNPQTAYASGGAAATSAGAFGFGSDAERAALTTLVANIRLALVANGIMS